MGPYYCSWDSVEELHDIGVEDDEDVGVGHTQRIAEDPDWGKHPKVNI